MRNVRVARVVLVLISLTGIACSNSPTATDAGDGGPICECDDADTPDVPKFGPPPACNVQGDPDAAGFCTLPEETPLSECVADPAAVVQDGFAFVIGGMNSMGNTTYPTIAVSSTAPDGGSLGPFSAASLPNPLGETAAVANNGFIYVMGGSADPSGQGGFPVSTVSAFQIDPSTGTLTNVTLDAGSNLPDAREGGAAAVSNGFVYFLGGEGAHESPEGPPGDPTGPAFGAPINADGTLGQWFSTTPLPGGRSHHGAAAANGFIYVVGGEYPDSLSFCEPNKILKAHQNPDGTLGDWTRATTEFFLDLKFPGVALVNNTLVVAGGVSHVDDLQVGNPYFFAATANPDGSLSGWTTIAQYATPLNERTLAAGPDAVYSFGGNPESGLGPSCLTEQLLVQDAGLFSCPP